MKPVIPYQKQLELGKNKRIQDGKEADKKTQRDERHCIDIGRVGNPG